MIFLMIGIAWVAIVCLAAMIFPLRVLAWLILMRLALFVPGRREIGVGDLVRVTRRDHPLVGQLLKVRSDRGNGCYWLEHKLSSRWSVGGEVSVEDVMCVKRSWVSLLSVKRGEK